MKGKTQGTAQLPTLAWGLRWCHYTVYTGEPRRGGGLSFTSTCYIYNRLELQIPKPRVLGRRKLAYSKRLGDLQANK